MSTIHIYMTAGEVKRLSQRDNDYLRSKLESNCALNRLLHRSINRPLLAELQCILDNKPVCRRKTEQYRQNSKVSVYSAEGKLVRIENCNGKVMKQMEV